MARNGIFARCIVITISALSIFSSSATPPPYPNGQFAPSWDARTPDWASITRQSGYAWPVNSNTVARIASLWDGIYSRHMWGTFGFDQTTSHISDSLPWSTAAERAALYNGHTVSNDAFRAPLAAFIRYMAEGGNPSHYAPPSGATLEYPRIAPMSYLSAGFSSDATLLRSMSVGSPVDCHASNLGYDAWLAWGVVGGALSTLPRYQTASDIVSNFCSLVDVPYYGVDESAAADAWFNSRATVGGNHVGEYFAGYYDGEEMQGFSLHPLLSRVPFVAAKNVLADLYNQWWGYSNPISNVNCTVTYRTEERMYHIAATTLGSVAASAARVTAEPETVTQSTTPAHWNTEVGYTNMFLTSPPFEFRRRQTLSLGGEGSSWGYTVDTRQTTTAAGGWSLYDTEVNDLGTYRFYVRTATVSEEVLALTPFAEGNGLPFSITDVERDSWLFQQKAGSVPFAPPPTANGQFVAYVGAKTTIPASGGTTATESYIWRDTYGWDSEAMAHGIMEAVTYSLFCICGTFAEPVGSPYFDKEWTPPACTLEIGTYTPSPSTEWRQYKVDFVAADPDESDWTLHWAGDSDVPLWPTNSVSYVPPAPGGGDSRDCVSGNGNAEVSDPDDPYTYQRARFGRIVNNGIISQSWQTTRTMLAPYLIGVSRFSGMFVY